MHTHAETPTVATVYEGKPIIADTMAVDLYAIDTAAGTHFVERIRDTAKGVVVSVRVNHPSRNGSYAACDLAPGSTAQDWLECTNRNAAQDVSL